MNCQDSF